MTLEVSMTAQNDTLTPAEAAFIAGVSIRDVHRTGRFTPATQN
jgi:hypothetical protein